MKVYPNGIIIVDKIDIICFGVILGYSTVKLIKMIKKYYSNKSQDPIVSELERISPVKNPTKYEPIHRLPRYLPRGGQLPNELKGVSILIKNKKLAKLVLHLL